MDEMIKAFLQRTGYQPWEPGKVDCLMALSDWCQVIGLGDPAGPYRGHYNTEDAYNRYIHMAGGMENLIGHEMGLNGIRRGFEPVPGDIGVIGSPHNILRQWGGLWDGRDWWVRSSQGYVPLKARTIAIWQTGGASCLK